MEVTVKMKTLTCVSMSLIVILIASQSFAGLDPATIEGLWLFDEGDGDLAKDSSGKDRDGELVKGAKWVDGKFGKALEFDGTGACVVVPEFENPTKAITVTAWVKSNTPTWNTHGWILSKRNAFIVHANQGSGNISWCVFIDGGWNTPHGWQTGEVGPDDITVWHMYTCTFDSSTGDWKIYIDAEEKSSLSCNKSEINLDTGHMTIGRDDDECPNRFGNGIVDEVAIFNVALSKDDINTIMKGFETALAVEPEGKLTTTWSTIKTQYYTYP